ncbi:MAG: DUF4340 domain-containing protein [Deltaproteobacteria bacterium]|nr:DUF4340 domain-containing protein [Deltaproteobacteria bacterium]MBV8454292.1 DUF4340 domain-containing protein [Deltaproteobacteria bacterium]
MRRLKKVKVRVLQAWKTIVVVILLAVIGGYAYYVSRQPVEQTPKLNAISAKDIQQIELRSPSRDIVVERTKDGWRFVKPIQGEADRTTADSMADAIAGLQITSTISESPADLAPFGLQNPAVNIIVTTKDHRVLPAIMVGKDTPVGNSSYIKSGQKPGILLVNNSFPSQVEKSVDDLRPRSLIGLKPDEIRQVVLDSGNGGLLELIKKGDQWTITKPKVYAADSSAVQQLLETVTNARITDFVDDNPLDLAKYGLANPSFMLTLSGGKANAQQSVLFGFKQPQADKSGLYARRGEGSDQPIITVDSYVLNGINKNFDDLRDKTVLGLDRTKVDHVMIASPKFDATLARAGGSKWNVVSNDRRAAAEALVADSLLDQLHTLKATRIAEDPMTHPDHYGMVKPTLTFTAYAKDGKELGTLRVSTMEVTLKPANPSPEDAGAAHPQTHNFAYATTGADSAVFEIPMQAASDLENTVNRLHSDTTTPPSPKPPAAAPTPGASAPQKK